MGTVIVIGAGIVGASAAYHLRKFGAEVIIVDFFHKGQATDAAAGIVCPWISQRRNKAWYELVKGGARFYPNLIRELEAEGMQSTGYSQVGAISIHTDLKKLEQMVERAKKRREDAPEIGEIELLSEAETKKLFPLLSEEYRAVFVTGGARVNGRELRNALIHSATQQGVKLITGNASLICSDHQIKGVKVNGEQIFADEVIITGGAWAKELLEQAGIHFHVTPQKAQIVHLEMKGIETSKWPVVMPPNNQYIVPFNNGRIVIGATHEDEAGWDGRVTAGGVSEILGKALAVAPELANYEIVETRVGFRPFTPGFLPVVGRIPGFEHVLIANGLGASGLTSGPYVGAELAKYAVGKETELDFSLYNVAGAIK